MGRAEEAPERRTEPAGFDARRVSWPRCINAMMAGSMRDIPPDPAEDRECQKPGVLRRELDWLVAKASVQQRGSDLKHSMGALG